MSSLAVNLSDSQDGLGLSNLLSSLATVATLALDNNNLLLSTSTNLDDLLLSLDLGYDYDSSFNSNLCELNLVGSDLALPDLDFVGTVTWFVMDDDNTGLVASGDS